MSTEIKTGGDAVLSVGGKPLVSFLAGTYTLEQGHGELRFPQVPRVHFTKGTSRRKRNGVQAIVAALVRDIYRREGVLLTAWLDTDREIILHAHDLAVGISVTWAGPHEVQVREVYP